MSVLKNIICQYCFLKCCLGEYNRFNYLKKYKGYCILFPPPWKWGVFCFYPSQQWIYDETMKMWLKSRAFIPSVLQQDGAAGGEETYVVQRQFRSLAQVRGCLRRYHGGVETKLITISQLESVRMGLLHFLTKHRMHVSGAENCEIKNL